MPVATVGAASDRLVRAMISTFGRFDNLAAGEYVVELLGDDGKPTDRKTAIVREGQTTTVTF